MPDDLSTVRALQRVAVHVVARARVARAGRFSLRVTPGGFGTPAMGDDGRVVRVAGATLLVESDAPGAPTASATPIAGSSLHELAAAAGVDLDTPLDVGHDTPPLGDPDEPLELDPAAAVRVGEWYATVAAALDRVVAAVPGGSSPTLPRLWPEHFDLAMDVDATAGVRVNLGGSPGDGFCPEPYLYVGPWGPQRPGDQTFWNAPFGAVLTARELPSSPFERVAAAAAFLLDGRSRLA